MCRVAFLFALCAVSALVLAQTLSDPALIDHSALPAQRPETGDRMWRRAEIRVVPLDLYLANKVELDSLRARVAQAQADAAKLEPAEPAAREQLHRQLQLLRALLNFAERQESNAGKGPAALEVQRHLNEIEGKVMCEACHSGMVARRASPGSRSSPVDGPGNDWTAAASKTR
jgi:hypothetical protein